MKSYVTSSINSGREKNGESVLDFFSFFPPFLLFCSVEESEDAFERLLRLFEEVWFSRGRVIVILFGGGRNRGTMENSKRGFKLIRRGKDFLTI